MDFFCRFYHRAFQARKALLRMGVVSSFSSDRDETNRALVSRACVSDADHAEYPERDDSAYRRVFLNEAEEALVSDEVPSMRARYW